jgi:hypothetical protein
MKLNTLLIIAAIVGIICGIASDTLLVAAQWANLILWALAGIGLGFFALGRQAVLWAGIVYGVFLTVTFLLVGFQGAPDKLPAFLLLTLAISVVGALGGLATVFAGSKLRGILKR